MGYFRPKFCIFDFFLCKNIPSEREFLKQCFILISKCFAFCICSYLSTNVVVDSRLKSTPVVRLQRPSKAYVFFVHTD